MLLGALILAASFLLPFGTARKEYREWLSAAPDRIYDEELNMTRRDAINLSLIELARAFGKAGNSDSRILTFAVHFPKAATISSAAHVGLRSSELQPKCLAQY